MSRTNIPRAPATGRPQSGHVPQDQGAQWTTPTGGRAPRQMQQAPQQSYAPQGYPAQAEMPPNAQGYGYAPPAQQSDPYAAVPPSGAQQAGYPYGQAAYDPYAPQQGAPAGGYADQSPNPAGYDQWAGQDRRALDLASYTPAAGRSSILTEFASNRHVQHQFSPPHTAGDDWSTHQQNYGGHHALDAAHDPGAYSGRNHLGALEQTYADDDGYDVPEPRRGRKMMIVLASAVVIGGGLAYAYSGLLGPGSDGKTPVVKSADGPFKVKPSEPGGKQFAHTDSKIMGRLSEGGSQGESSSGDNDTSGARRVPVLTVGRDGTIQVPAASDESPSRPTVSVPGLTVIDGPLGGPVQGPPPATPARATASATQDSGRSASPPAPESTPKAPIVVSKAEPAKAPETTQSLSDVDDTPPAPKAPVKTAAVSPAPAAPAASDPAPAAPAGNIGYVAVLASVPASPSSRMDALKQFANMQEKYGAILQDKTPDVKEANLGAKGTYHRLLVGPPGSRDAASALCLQLKAEGYSNCWVTAY